MDSRVALVLVLTSGFVACAFDKLLQVDDAEFTTSRKFYEEGDTVVLNCTLKAKVTGYTARDLTFGTNRRVPLDPRSIRVLSEKTATVTLTNITMAWNHKLVYCQHTSWWIQKMAFVNVGRRPLVSQVTECVLDDWQWLQCSWQPSRQAQVNHTTFQAYDDCAKNHHEPRECMNTTLLWTVDNVTWHTRESTKGDRCTVPVNPVAGLSADGHVQVKVRVENILGNTTSPVVQVNLSTIVRPAPVSQLAYTLTRGRVHVSWQLPVSAAGRALDVRLLWRGHYDKDTWREVWLGVNVTSHSMVVEPYSRYDVKVDIRPRVGGLWSLPATASFLSLPVEPQCQPAVVLEAFQLLPNSKTSRADVVVYWKPLTRRQYGGPDVQYVLWLRSEAQLTEMFPVSPDVSNKLLPAVQADTDTGVQVVAKNTVGYSNVTAVTLIIPGTKTVVPVLPQYRLVADSATSVHVDVYGPVTGDTLRLFWCHSLVHDVCLGEVEWSSPMTLPASVSVDVTSTYSAFSYGLSVTSADQHTSGIHWYKSCVHDANIVPLSPSNLFWAVDGRDNLTVTLTWEPPACVGGATGLLTGYLVIWVTVDNNDTLGTAVNVTLPFTVTNLTLPQLTHPHLLVTVYALSVGGASPPATLLLNTAPYWRRSGNMTVVVVVCACVLAVLLTLVILCIVRRCYGLGQWYKSGLNIEPPCKMATHYVSELNNQSAYRMDDLLSAKGKCHTQSSGGSYQSDDSGLDVKCTARDRGLESDVSLLTMSPMSPLLLSHDDDVFTDLYLDPADLRLLPKVVYDVPRPQSQLGSMENYSVFFGLNKQLPADTVTYTMVSDCHSSGISDLHLTGLSSGHSTDINSNTLSSAHDQKVEDSKSQSVEGNDEKVESDNQTMEAEQRVKEDNERVESNNANKQRVEESMEEGGGYVPWCDVPVFTPAR